MAQVVPAPKADVYWEVGLSQTNAEEAVVVVLELQQADAEQAPSPPVRRPKSEVDTIRRLEGELDAYLAQMTSFPELDLGDIFSQLAAMSARAMGIRVHLVRHETRLYAAFRTRQLDPFIEEVDRQFRTWSRQLAVRQQEWEMAKGGT